MNNNFLLHYAESKYYALYYIYKLDIIKWKSFNLNRMESLIKWINKMFSEHFHMVMHFFTSRDLQIYQKPISIFCEDDISKHLNIFCKTFFLFQFYKEKQKTSCHRRLWNRHYSGTIWALSVKEESVKNKLF